MPKKSDAKRSPGTLIEKLGAFDSYFQSLDSEFEKYEKALTHMRWEIDGLRKSYQELRDHLGTAVEKAFKEESDQPDTTKE